MRKRLFMGVAMLAAMAGSASAAVFTDTFSGSVLNPIWTVGDNAGSYAPGGFAQMAGWGVYEIQSSMVGGASNLRANMGPVGAGDSARVDAILRTDQYGNGRWSNQVVLYFDNENWMGLRMGYSGGEDGIYRQGMVAGNNFWDQDGTAYSGTVKWDFHIVGVELTPTEIKFYTSNPGAGGHFGETNIDAYTSVVPSMTMPRPASFTGQAYMIVGKGFAWSNAHGAYLNNNAGDVANSHAAANYIDYARFSTTTIVPEPAGLSCLLVGAGAILARRRSR